MRFQGRITSWKDDKGFGFVTPNGGGKPVFVHINSFSSRQRRPEGNELVTYELAVDNKGRPQAKAVAFVGQRSKPPSASSGRSAFPPLFAICFVVFLVGAVLAGRLPVAVLVFYAVASILAFFAYAFDKSAASRNEWRTQEKTLHLFAVFGGWPGALVAQRVLRHKSVKVTFQIMFWTTVILNCSILGWMFTPGGVRTLNYWLSNP